MEIPNPLKRSTITNPKWVNRKHEKREWKKLQKIERLRYKYCWIGKLTILNKSKRETSQE